MSTYDVAFVGAGSNRGNQTGEGFVRVDEHAAAYERLETCELVACADGVRGNAEAFAATHGIADARVFEDYRRMLAEVEPDVVSVRTPPSTRAEVVTGTVESGVVDAVHCERPMAHTWGSARRILEACERADVALTFDDVERFGDPLRDAKALLDDGAVGDLRRVEYNGESFPDGAAHAVDLCNYFNDDRPAEWVIGQVGHREEVARDDAGSHDENQLLATWEYDNGVYGLAATGPSSSMNDGDWRLIGEDGFIDVHLTDAIAVRVCGANGNTEKQYEALARGESCTDRAVADAIEALDTGRASALCAANARTATEIVFAGYESVRRRGRVDLPLETDDPLEAMASDGTLDRQPGDD